MRQTINSCVFSLAVILLANGVIVADQKIDDRDCQSHIALRAESNANGILIECAFVCDGGSLKLDNAMLDSERICDTRLWIEGDDGKPIKTLVDLSLDSKKAWAPTVCLYGSGVAGRQFFIKLPPGSYKLRAEYIGLVWSQKEQKCIRQLAMTAARDFEVKRQFEVDSGSGPVLESMKSPLEGTISIRNPRLAAGDCLNWTVRFTNISDEEIWCYNLLMLENLQPRCANLFLFCKSRGELWDILFDYHPSVRRERVTDWLVLPPGGFLAFDCKRRVREFTIERGRYEGIELTPIGKFAIEFRLHSAMIGRPPRNIPSWEKFPERTDVNLTWDQWRDSAPGGEIFRSKQVEFEVIME